MKGIIERYRARIEQSVQALSNLEITEQNVKTMCLMLEAYDTLIRFLRDEGEAS